MRLKSIIKKIALYKDIVAEPPILIDIGASGKLNAMWSKIASFSICIAFDADQREFDYIEQKETKFLKQFVFNKIVVASSDKPKQPFYLTHSPYCSSLLKPNINSLKEFQISDKFEVKEIVEIDVIELKIVLAQLNINRIDWFKTDSQGTDLSLFKSLTEEIQNNIIVLELEPGFMNAYLGEDKIVDVMNEMENRPFILSNFTTKGSLRIPKIDFDRIVKSDLTKKIISHTYKKTPGWAEMIYLNNMLKKGFKSREFLLAWLFATLQNHHDLAFVYADNASVKFNDEIFINLKQYSEKKLRTDIYTFKSVFKMFNIFFQKYITKTY